MQLTEAELLTIVAILIAPLLGAWMVRSMGIRNETHSRRMHIFHSLLRARGAPNSLESVGTLNLIEIEFAGEKDVLDAQKELFMHFSTDHRRWPGENACPSRGPEEQKRCDLEFNARINGDGQRLLSKLLIAIGTSLRFKEKQLRVLNQGYTPTVWMKLQDD